MIKYQKLTLIYFRSLQRTLNDLKDYQKKHDYWQQQNEKLNAEQVSIDTKFSMQHLYETIKIRESSSEVGRYPTLGFMK